MMANEIDKNKLLSTVTHNVGFVLGKILLNFLDETGDKILLGIGVLDFDVFPDSLGKTLAQHWGDPGTQKVDDRREKGRTG
jgi:hypothetical protein